MKLLCIYNEYIVYAAKMVYKLFELKPVWFYRLSTFLVYHLKIRRFVNSGRTGSIPVSGTNIHAPYRGLALLEGFFVSAFTLYSCCTNKYGLVRFLL